MNACELEKSIIANSGKKTISSYKLQNVTRIEAETPLDGLSFTLPSLMIASQKSSMHHFPQSAPGSSRTLNSSAGISSRRAVLSTPVLLAVVLSSTRPSLANESNTTSSTEDEASRRRKEVLSRSKLSLSKEAYEAAVAKQYTQKQLNPCDGGDCGN